MLNEQLRKQKLLILNDSRLQLNLMLLVGIAIFIYWTVLYYLQNTTWYFNLGLIIAVALICYFLLAKTYPFFSKKTNQAHYASNFILTAYLFLLIWQTDSSPTYMMLTLLVLSVSGSTFPDLNYLKFYYIFFFVISCFIPETSQTITKWFFSMAIPAVGSITYLQFVRRLKTLEVVDETYLRFQEISEGNYGGILIFKDSQIIESNATLKHIFQLDQFIDLTRVDIRDLIGVDAFKKIKDSISRHNETSLEGEMEIFGKFRGRFFVEYRLKQIFITGEKAWALFFKDVSELKESRVIISAQADTLKRVSRLSDLGELSAGIAHEINNPLAIISGMADEILFQLDNNQQIDPDHLKFLNNKIIQNTERISKIIKGLKKFVRDGTNDPFQQEGVDKLILESVEICKTSLAKQQIEFELKGVGEDNFIVKCRAVQIEQVLVNIINNARDAISSQENPWIQLELSSKDEFVEISITDSGDGIPENEIGKVFDTYYTTKSAGHGTGLGLSIAKRIIEEHQGEILIDRDCDNTRFVIRLPLVQEMNSKNYPMS